MNDPTTVTVTLRLDGNNGETHQLNAVVENTNGISFVDAFNELGTHVQKWATSFLDYGDTTKVQLSRGQP